MAKYCVEGKMLLKEPGMRPILITATCIEPFSMDAFWKCMTELMQKYSQGGARDGDRFVFTLKIMKS